MNIRRSLRAALLLASVVTALFAVSVSGASAAGAPTLVRVGPSQLGISYFEFHGVANPNGSATTVSLEYRKHGSGAEFKTIYSENIGSGTSTVNTATRLLDGLTHDIYYDIRVSATNAFGTTRGEELYESNWTIAGQPKTHVASYATSGTFALEYKASGIPTKVECNESSYGTLNNFEGKGDSFHLGLSNCATYQSGKKVCSPTAPWGVVLDGTFTSEMSTLNWNVCPNEEVMYHLTFSEPFKVQMSELSLVEQPVTMTANVQYTGATNAKITITSNWSLTGEDKGLKFHPEAE
jgi:hypothetical protein